VSGTPFLHIYQLLTLLAETGGQEGPFLLKSNSETGVKTDEKAQKPVKSPMKQEKRCKNWQESSS